LMHERQCPQAPSGIRLISTKMNHCSLPLVFVLPHLCLLQATLTPCPHVSAPKQTKLRRDTTGECCTRCQQFDNCTAFTWLNGSPPYNNYCSLKLANVGHTTTRSVGATSGWRYGIPPPTPPMGGVFLKAAWAGEVRNLNSCYSYELTIRMFALMLESPNSQGLI